MLTVAPVTVRGHQSQIPHKSVTKVLRSLHCTLVVLPRLTQVGGQMALSSAFSALVGKTGIHEHGRLLRVLKATGCQAFQACIGTKYEPISEDTSLSLWTVHRKADWPHGVVFG